MIVIPAIDLKDGKCVRLLQGRMERVTVFSDDPGAMATKWAELGAELIHIVDLDGAVRKRPCNLDAIRSILSAVATPVQVGGGIRDQETIQAYLEMGVRRVVVGTEAVRNPLFVREIAEAYPERIVLAIDARDGWVAVEGWTETTRTRAADLARRFEGVPIAAINFTDIHRDGMQTGPNIEQTRRLAEATAIPVVASGGVSTLADIEALIAIEAFGVAGVITGRAIYAGTLDFAEAVALTRRKSSEII